MSLEQLLLILRARYVIALLVLVATVAVTAIVSYVIPPQYVATATLVVDVRSPDPVAGVLLPAMGIPGYNMATQVEIISSDRVSQGVVRLLKLESSPTITRQWLEATKGKGRKEIWLADLLKKGLEVRPARESNVIAVNYRSIDPAFSAAVANAFAKVYIDTNIELKVEPARQYATWFEQQSRTLRERLEEAQTRLSGYQKEKGIVVTDERLDVESTRLNELQTQLMAAEMEGAAVRSKQKTGTGDTLQDVMQNPLILQLKADIAKQEAKFDEVGGNLGRNHPQYLRMASEIESLKQKLAQETLHITSSIGTSGNMTRDKVAELRSVVEAQRRRILELRNARDASAVLQREVEGARKTYEAVAQRYTQSSLESQATQTNISILTPATEPLLAAWPNTPKNLLASLLVGTLLGIGVALGLELRDRRIRAHDDVTNGVGIPILAMIRGRKASWFDRVFGFGRRGRLADATR